MPVTTKERVRRDDLAAEFRRRRLTVTEVARRCRYSRQHVSDLLNGRRRLTYRAAREISLRTHIPLSIVQGDVPQDGQG